MLAENRVTTACRRMAMHKQGCPCVQRLLPRCWGSDGRRTPMAMDRLRVRGSSLMRNCRTPVTDRITKMMPCTRLQVAEPVERSPCVK